MTNQTFGGLMRFDAPVSLPSGYLGSFGVLLKGHEEQNATGDRLYGSSYGIAGVVVSDPAIPAPVAILGSFYQGTRVSNFTIVPLASLPTQSISIEVNRQYLGLYSDGGLVAFLPNPIPPSFNVTRSKAVGHNVTTDENISISTETGRVGLIALFSPFSGAQSSGTICYDNVALSCLQSSCAVMNEPVSPAALVVSPGFEVVFAVAGLLAMAHLARRRNGRDRLQ